MKTRIRKLIDVSWMDAGVYDIDIEADSRGGADLDEIETNYMPPSAALRKEDKKQKRLIEKKKIRIKNLREVIGSLPGPGEDIFIIGGGNIDAIHSIHVALDFLPQIEEMYIATWSMTMDNIDDLFRMFDEKKIKKLSIVIATTFRRIRRVECPALIKGMQARGQRMVICKNHSKIILMKAPGHHLVVRGSANFTCNPRIEQIDYSNNRELYKFNQNWMESILKMAEKVEK